MSNPFSLRIFVADGDPDGLRVVERSNWIGKALIFPRALPPRASRNPSLEKWCSTLSPQCGDSLSCASARRRSDATLPVSDEGLDTGRRFGALALGKRRTDAFDRRSGLRRDAQCGLAGCCRLEVRVGLPERHAANGRPAMVAGAS